MGISDSDMRLLRDLIAWSEEHDPDGARFSIRSFEEMFVRNRPLSDAQRRWATHLLASVTDTPEYENGWSSGKVMKGREVETPEVLRKLPKGPPGRMAT